MKQKTAIVAALMHSPEIIILDEPTTGLDPLMRDAFVNIIKEEKARGATIIMSNHMFDELEETCDYVGFIKDGHLIDVVDMNALRNLPYRDFEIQFKNKEDYEEFKVNDYELLEKNDDEKSVLVRCQLEHINSLIEEMRKHQIVYFTERKHKLDELFERDVDEEDEENGSSNGK